MFQIVGNGEEADETTSLSGVRDVQLRWDTSYFETISGWLKIKLLVSKETIGKFAQHPWLTIRIRLAAIYLT